MSTESLNFRLGFKHLSILFSVENNYAIVYAHIVKEVTSVSEKKKLLFFLLPLFPKVSQVYRDRSIGNPINIVVVKIVLLEYNQVGN